MNLFMPSEIARLVLGYLRETGCIQTAGLYLSESPHLIEYAACLKRGHEYPTTIGGRSLTDMLRELSTTKATLAKPTSAPSTDMTLVLERIDCGITQLRSLLTNGRFGIEHERSDSEDAVCRDRHWLPVTPRTSISMSVSTPPSSEPRDLTRVAVTPRMSVSTTESPTSPLQPVDLSKTPGTVISPTRPAAFRYQRRPDTSPHLAVSRASSPTPSSHLDDLSRVAVAPRSVVSTATSPTPPPSQPKDASQPVVSSISRRFSPPLDGHIEIVSNDVPTIRIEESSSPGSRGCCIVSVEKDNQSSDQLLCTPKGVACGAKISETTPLNRPPDIYSSAASIARSALIFSFGIEALQTPVKESDDGNWKSPRRKNQLPRKRLTYTPSSSAKNRVQLVCDSEPDVVPSTSTDVVQQSDDCVDISELIGQLLSNTALQERIADNINRVVCSTSEDTRCSNSEAHVSRSLADRSVSSAALRGSTIPTTSEAQSDASVSPVTEHCVPDNVVKDIIDRTESDPLFEAFINIFFDKHDANAHDSEQSGTPSSDSHGTPISQCIDSDQASVSNTPLVTDADKGVPTNKEPSKIMNSALPVGTVNRPSPMLLKTPPRYTQAPSMTNVKTPRSVPVINHTLASNPEPSVMPHIVINDLHLESSVVTEMMTRMMTFTVLEPTTQTLNLAELRDGPCRLQFTTLSPGQLRTLGNTQQLTISPVKSTDVLPNQAAVEIALRANNKRPKLRCQKFTRKKTATSVISAPKNSENHQQQQQEPTSVETCVSHLGKAGKKVCAVRLDFTNSGLTEIETNSTDRTEKQSPQLRSLLVQSDKVLHRRVATSSLDANHVRVLNFGGHLDVGSEVSIPATSVIVEDCSRSSGDTRRLDESDAATPAAAVKQLISSVNGISAAGLQSVSNAKAVPTALTDPPEPQSKTVLDKRLRIRGNVKRKRPNDSSKGSDCRRSKSKLAENVLSSMDVDKFLSSVKYVE